MNLKNKRLSRKVIVFFALLITAVALSSVIIIRLAHDRPVFPLGESYYNLRMGNSLREDPLLAKDPIQGTNYVPNPYHYFIAGLLSIASIEAVSIFLPILLGALSSLMIFRLLSSHRFSERNAVFSMLILLFTPAYIVIFTGMHVLGFSIFLSMLSMVLILDDRRSWLVVPGIACLAALSFTSITSFIITLIITIMLSLLSKRGVRNIILYVALPSVFIFAASLAIYGANWHSLGFHALDLKESLSILGAPLGMDVFLIMLFLTGFLVVWSKHQKRRIVHLASLGFVALAFVNTVALAFSSLIIAVYCVIAINFFYHRRWELKVVRTGTMMLIICALAFSLLSQISTIVNAQPDNALRNALISIKGPNSVVVFTDLKYGFLSEFYTGRPSLLDSNSITDPKYKELINASNYIFNASRIREVEPMLNQYSIGFIVITPQMKDELLHGKDEKLLFLVRHSEKFFKVFDDGGVEVWQYHKDANRV